MPLPPPIPAAEAARLRLQRQRIRRWAYVFIYGIPLLLLVIACYVAFGPKPPPPPKPIPVSPQRVADATQNIDAVRQALTQPALPAPPPASAPAQKAAPRKKGQTANSAAPSVSSPVQVTPQANGPDLVTMRVSQADLNAYLSNNPKTKAMLMAKGIQAVSVSLSAPANITILAAATYKGITGNAEVDAVMEPDPTTAIRLDIQDARFGRFPPPVIVAAAHQIVTRLTGGAHSPLPLTVTSVKVEGSDLVLSGVRKTSLPQSL